jgi:hypothetical protein
VSGEKGANLAPKSVHGGRLVNRARGEGSTGASLSEEKLSFHLFIRQLRLRSSDDPSVNRFLKEGGDAVDEFDAQASSFQADFYLAKHSASGNLFQVP